MAEYAIALNADGAGTIKLLDLMCGSYLIENGIRPHLKLGVFQCDDGDDVFMTYFEVLQGYLEPVRTRMKSVGCFNGSVPFAEAELNNALNDDFYKTYTVLSRHYDLGGLGNYRPQNWIPHVSLGYEEDREQGTAYFDLLTKSFVPFDIDFVSVSLIRCDPHTVMKTFKLTHGNDIEGYDTDTEIQKLRRRALRLELGMDEGTVHRLMGIDLDIRDYSENGHSYRHVRLTEAGVWLFFKPDTGRLYTIRFDAPFDLAVCGAKIGLTRLEMQKAKGNPDRFITPNHFYCPTWYYDHDIENACLRCDFEKDPSGRCSTIFIC